MFRLPHHVSPNHNIQEDLIQEDLSAASTLLAFGSPTAVSAVVAASAALVLAL